MPQTDALGCRRAVLPVGLDQLLQANGTEVAAETSSIADTSAAVKMVVASRAEEKLANIGKNPLWCLAGPRPIPAADMHRARQQSAAKIDELPCRTTSVRWRAMRRSASPRLAGPALCPLSAHTRHHKLLSYSRLSVF